MQFEEIEPGKTKVEVTLPGKKRHYRIAIPIGILAGSIFTISGWLLWVGGWASDKKHESSSTKTSIDALYAAEQKNVEDHEQFKMFIVEQRECNKQQKERNKNLDRIVNLLAERALSEKK